MNINGSTSLYGIIGWPVEHSLSPIFQSQFLAQQKINAAYLPFAVAPDLLAQAMEGLWALGIQGFNVTIPHKEDVFQMVTADTDASLIGAVNTVRRSDHGWQATNTDWFGFKAAIEGLQADVSGQSILLFGAGGTARAVLHALNQLNPAKVFICNRNPARLKALIDTVSTAYPALHCQPLAWDQQAVSAASANASLLINTTAIGLKNDEPFPFQLSGRGVAFDAVYRPNGETAFTHVASQSGRLSSDGLPMLVAQGAASFSWWHNCPRPNIQQTLSAMQQHLGRPNITLPGWID